MRFGMFLAAAALGIIAAPAARAWPGCEVDVFSAAVHGDTLTVSHGDATYNCCMDGVEYSVTQTDTRIDVVETELITNYCACLCCYDLAVDVAGLAPGQYLLCFAWRDDTGQWEEWTTDVTISGTGSVPFVASVSNSGCIDPSAAPDAELAVDAWGRVKAQYR